MNSDAILSAIEIDTQPNPDAAVIWLHGLGDDGYGWSSVIASLNLPPQSRIRFLFPHAPEMPVSINNGHVMPAWYDLIEGDLLSRADLEGIRVSQARIDALIERERGRGIDASRIVLAGFSQGGVIVLQTGLRYPERLAGIMALSTYLADAPNLSAEASAANRELPIFMAHGSEDPVVLPQWAEASRDALQAAGYPVAWHVYPMQHSATSEEMHDAGVFLAQVIPPLAV